MGHILQLKVSEDVYESLVRVADQTGQRPEDVAVQWLVSAARDLVDDPLEPFIGAFPSNVPDWSDQHDRYIGNAILEQGQSTNGEGA